MAYGGTRRRPSTRFLRISWRISWRVSWRKSLPAWLLAIVCLASASAPACAAAAPRRKKPPPAASADPSANQAGTTPNQAQAADLFKRSSEAYLQGKFEQAIGLLDQAYALDPQPVLIYNKARAHESLGHFEEAAKLYQRYLAEDPTPKDRGAIEQRIATLRKREAERKQLEKEKADVEQKRAEQEQRQQALDQRERDVQDAPRGRESARKRSPFPYVVAGVGAAGLATGTVFGLLALDRQSAGRKATSLRDAKDALDTGKGFATASNVSFIVGGALAAAGAIWWVLDGKAVNATTNHAGAVQVGFGLADVLLGGAF